MTTEKYWEQEAERRWKKILRVDKLIEEDGYGFAELCENCKILVRKALWEEE